MNKISTVILGVIGITTITVAVVLLQAFKVFEELDKDEF